VSELRDRLEEIVADLPHAQARLNLRISSALGSRVDRVDYWAARGRERFARELAADGVPADEYVIDELTTNAGTTDDTGADLFEKLRKAVTTIQGQGFTPNLIALSATDAEEIDLTRTESGAGLLVVDPAPRAGAFSPLWGARVVVGANVIDPIVMDTSGVQVWVGTASFDADLGSRFSTNESRFRLESPVLCVVRQPLAVQVVAAGTS
jgi:hypothetical protein